MEYRQFGRTGMKVSAIGFGCWEISGTYGPIDETQFEQAVHGRSTPGSIVSTPPKRTAWGFPRGRWRALWVRGGAMSSSRPRSASATRTCRIAETAVARGSSRRSNKVCGISTPIMSTSIWCIGRICNTPFEETMRALDDVVAQGKARSIGVSNFRLSQLEACMKLRRIDVVQYGWNMFDRRMQREIFPWCTANGVARDGLRLAGLRDAERHVPRGHGVRRDRLAVEARRAGQPESVPNHVRPGSFRAQPARGRGSQGAGGQIRQDAAAIRAALDAQQPGRAHRAGRVPAPRRGGGKSRRARFHDFGRGHGRDRHDLHPSRRRDRAAGLAGRRFAS